MYLNYDTRKKITALVSGLVVFVVGFFSAKLVLDNSQFIQLMFSPSSSNVELVANDRNNDVMLLSLVPNTDNDLLIPYIAEFDLKTESIDIKWNFPGKYPRSNSNGTFTYIAAVPTTTVSAVLQPRIYNSVTDEMVDLPFISDLVPKEALVVSKSDNNKYAYSSFVDSELFDADPLSIDNQMVALHQGGEVPVHIIENAKKPLFVSSDSLYFMRKDGIYSIDLDTLTESLVVPFGFMMSVNDSYAVSSNGTYVIMTSPTLNSFTIYKRIADTYSVMSTQSARSSIGYFSPVFSTSGEHVSVIKKDLSNLTRDGAFTKVTLQIFETENGALVSEIDIEDSNILLNSVRLSDWVTR